MTLPRTAAEVLSGHVTLEVRCMDRVLLTFRQPRLQYGQGIHGFFSAGRPAHGRRPAADIGRLVLVTVRAAVILAPPPRHRA